MKKFQIVNNGGGKATIKIIGEINWWRNSSDEFTRMVDDLLKQGIKDIHVYINTPGGSMFDANEIGNQILRFTGSRTGKLGALCASAGTTLSTYLQYVEGSSNTQYMIHDPAQMIYVEHLEDFESAKKLYKNLRDNAIDRYHKKTGMAKADISQAMKATTWYTAQEAKELGFIDEITEELDNILPPDTQDVLNRYGTNVTESILNQLPKPAQSQIENETENDMKEIAALLGLPENATIAQILAAITAQKTIAENAVKILVQMGVSKGLKEATLTKLAKADFDAALELVNETKAPETTTPTITENNGGQGTPNPDNRDTTLTNLLTEIVKNAGAQKPTGEKLSFSQMLEKDKTGLRNLINTKPEEAIELFRAEYGTLAKIEDLKDLVK